MSFCVKVRFFLFSLNKLTSWHLGLRWGAWGEVGMAANLDEASQRRMAMSPMPPFTNVQNSDNFKDKFLQHFTTSFLQCQCHGFTVREPTPFGQTLFRPKASLVWSVASGARCHCTSADSADVHLASFSSRNDSNFNIYLMYFGMLSISLHTKGSVSLSAWIICWAPPCFLQRPRWPCFFAQSDTRRDLDS